MGTRFPDEEDSHRLDRMLERARTMAEALRDNDEARRWSVELATAGFMVGVDLAHPGARRLFAAGIFVGCAGDIARFMTYAIRLAVLDLLDYDAEDDLEDGA